MIFRKGDVYRNSSTNVPCFIKENCNDIDYIICWSYEDDKVGYQSYEGRYTHGELLNEMSKGYLDVVRYRDKESIILFWIPQHNVVSLC